MTKPIELGVKEADVPKDMRKQAGTGKNGPAKGRKEAFMAADRGSEAEIMALTPARARKTGPKPEIFDQIGQRLRNVYNDVLTQAVPYRFLDLLQTLESGTPAETEGQTETECKSKMRGGQESRAAGGRKKDAK